ncbi:MAG TPA: nickel-type superoxide dismutase maturation protease [Actinobacteria bacterium]|nr:nickel-type superoxide dismutase maturation protease [Actinomycetota bacterium]
MFGLTAIAIAGPSMEPTLKSGEWWVVRRTTNVRPGQMIVFWHPLRTDLLTVKRVHHRRPAGWWVLGDNPEASEDSRFFGAVDPAAVVGRLVLRYRPAVALART